MIDRILNYIKRRVIPIVLIFITLFCGIFYIYVVNYGKNMSEKFSNKQETIISKDTIIKGIKYNYIEDKRNNLILIVNKDKSKNIEEYSRVLSQLKTIRHRLDSHSRVLDYFLINLYFFVVIQTVFMVLICIIGVVISKKGWGDSSDNLLGSFLIVAGFLLFFQVLPKGMRIENNITTNKGYFLVYQDMENRIYTYLSNDSEDKNFSHTIDEMLKTYGAVSLDLQQVPISEVQKSFSEIRKSIEQDTK